MAYMVSSARELCGDLGHRKQAFARARHNPEVCYERACHEEMVAQFQMADIGNKSLGRNVPFVDESAKH